MSDGVWAQLGERKIADILRMEADPQDAAARLAMGAEDSGSPDNCTALVLRIDALPPDRLRDNIARLHHLPLPPRLKPGQQIDGLTTDSLTATYALGDTLQLARRFKLSSYDASYLELAMREGLPLATLDSDLRSAMLQTGVALA